MTESRAFNMDCMDELRAMPDNAFDLAVVDPPYGDAISGEAADTHTHTHSACGVTVGTAGTGTAWNRFGGRFDRYKTLDNRSPAQFAEREREREPGRTGCPNRRNMGRKVR